MAKTATAVLERSAEVSAPAAPALVAPVAVPTVPKNYRLFDRDMHRADEAVRWRVVVSPLIPYEAILNDRAFWANVVRSKDMQIGNIVEVHVADNSYYAELYVLDVGAVWAKVAQITKVDFEKQTTAGDADIPGYTFGWDRLQKHHILRDKDRQLIGQGFSSRGEAHSYLVDHVQRLGA